MKALILLCFYPFYASAELNTRIIGGFDTSISMFPFAAAIDVQTSTSKYFCGGTLYGTEWIITAGQCVNGAVLFTISLGSVSLNDEDENRLTVATSIYHLHPDFNPATLDNDIGIIQLRMPITHTNFIKSVGQMPTSELNLGIQFYTIGWGQLGDDDGALSPKLQVAYIGAITNEQCKMTYGSQITDNMVCIVGTYNQGICHGDTGGPLLTRMRTGVMEHIGIASFMSANGCESIDPNGFTRTYPYVDWIANITNIKNDTIPLMMRM